MKTMIDKMMFTMQSSSDRQAEMAEFTPLAKPNMLRVINWISVATPVWYVSFMLLVYEGGPLKKTLQNKLNNDTICTNHYM